MFFKILLRVSEDLPKILVESLLRKRFLSPRDIHVMIVKIIMQESELAKKSPSARITWADLLVVRRSIAVISGCSLLISAGILCLILVGKLDYIAVVLAASGIGAAMFDLGLLWWRVYRGIYGTNRSEAEELLRFFASWDGSDQDPPLRALREPVQQTEQTAIEPVAGVRS